MTTFTLNSTRVRLPASEHADRRELGKQPRVGREVDHHRLHIGGRVRAIT